MKMKHYLITTDGDFQTLCRIAWMRTITQVVQNRDEELASYKEESLDFAKKKKTIPETA